MRRVVVLLATLAASGSVAIAQAPDLVAMSGVPLAMADVPAGVATVRVVRYDLAHPAVGLEVILKPTGDGEEQRRRTGPAGRARFEHLGGHEYVAHATVAGEQLRSRPFRAGPSHGVRLLLVAARSPAAGDDHPASRPTLPGWRPALPRGPGAASLPASAPSGPVTRDPSRLWLASGSEIMVEFVEDVVRVTASLRLRNDGPSYDPGSRGLVFALPAGVTAVNLPLESPVRLTADDTRAVQLEGLVAPGEARVKFQYVVRYAAGRRLVMPLPVRSERLLVAIRPTGLTVEVSGARSRDEMETPEGGRFVVHRFGSLPPGAPVTVTLSHSRRLEWLTLLCLVGLLAWLVVGARTSASRHATRAALEARREALFAAILALDTSLPRGGRPSPEERRQELLTELLEVYGQLHHHGAMAPAPPTETPEAPVSRG